MLIQCNVQYCVEHKSYGKSKYTGHCLCICSKTVRENQEGTQCDLCNKCHHTQQTTHMRYDIYALGQTDVNWHSDPCGLPPLINSLFEDIEASESNRNDLFYFYRTCFQNIPQYFRLFLSCAQQLERSLLELLEPTSNHENTDCAEHVLCALVLHWYVPHLVWVPFYVVCECIFILVAFLRGWKATIFFWAVKRFPQSSERSRDNYLLGLYARSPGAFEVLNSVWKMRFYCKTKPLITKLRS